jgi:hypothetical protein
MIKISLLLTLLLSSCANMPKVVNTATLIAPNEIMEDCQEYIKPKVGTPAEFINVIIENKKIYALCVNQNKAKKDFILNEEKK